MDTRQAARSFRDAGKVTRSQHAKAVLARLARKYRRPGILARATLEVSSNGTRDVAEPVIGLGSPVIAVLVVVAVLALAAALALGWRPGSSRVTRPLREDEVGVLAGRRFADAVEAMRFEEAEAHARHWFQLANDPDPPSTGRRPDRAGTDWRVPPRIAGSLYWPLWRL
jgi:hypothetical protein